MTTADLEQSYRRLLSCYPAEHRGTYGEEMIGVLLASARPDQRRPGFAETLDLFGGGAKVRLRALLTGAPDPGWRNALALTTLITPILLAILARDTVPWFAPLSWHSDSTAAALVGAAILLVPCALGLAGLGRLAALAAAATAIWLIGIAAGTGQLGVPTVAGYAVLLTVQAVALSLSPGPGHALKLVTRKGVLVTLPWLLAFAYMASLIPGHYPVPLPVAELGIAVIALAGLAGLTTASGRRLFVLVVATPLSGLSMTILTFAHVNFDAMDPVAQLVALYLPPVLLSALTFLAVRRSGERAAPPDPGVAG